MNDVKFLAEPFRNVAMHQIMQADQGVGKFHGPQRLGWMAVLEPVNIGSGQQDDQLSVGVRRAKTSDRLRAPPSVDRHQ